MLVDLHTHSTASDGQYSPTELVRLAKEHGVQAVALTDHDTIQGLHEAVHAGQAYGIRVICGIELSAIEYPDLHILGHGIGLDNPELIQLCTKMKNERDQHKYHIADYLKDQGILIDVSEVEALAAGGVVGRPHFAQVMVKHGYVQSTREAFDRYLDTEAYRRIKRFKPSAQTCIEVIRSAGGKAAMAHPYQLHMQNDSLAQLLKKLTSYGLSGLECYYPKHTKEQTAFYLDLAKKFNLHITAGSDFHGERVHPGDRFMPVELNLEWLPPKSSDEIRLKG